MGGGNNSSQEKASRIQAQREKMDAKNPYW